MILDTSNRLYFAIVRSHTAVMPARTDWPLGPLLTDAIRESGMSKRSVARATGISEARIRQLETGYQANSTTGDAPIRTTEKTVYALASALGIDPRHALTLAGLNPDWVPSAPLAGALGAWSVDDLLSEIGQRFESAARSAAPEDVAVPALSIHEVLARGTTISAIERLADERRAAGDESGAERLSKLALDMHAELDALDAAEANPQD